MMVYACDSSTEEEMEEVHKLEAYLGSIMQPCLRKKERKRRLREKRERKKQRS